MKTFLDVSNLVASLSAPGNTVSLFITIPTVPSATAIDSVSERLVPTATPTVPSATAIDSVSGLAWNWPLRLILVETKRVLNL